MSNVKGIQKVLTKLEQSIKDGNFYEASQMYHSISQRYIKQSKQNEAILLLSSGISNLLAANQPASALDLSIRLLDVYQNIPQDSTSRSRLMDIFYAFPITSESSKPYRYEFAKLCKRWSSKINEGGDELLNHDLGFGFYQGFF